MTVRTINHTMPTLKEVMETAIFNFPDGYRWPRSAVEREAVSAAKDALKVKRTDPLPRDADMDVRMGDGYGVIQIRNGQVVE